MLAVYIKDEDPAVVITGTVNNLHLSDASKAAIALLQPVAVAMPASYYLCNAVIAQAPVTVSAVATNVGTAAALASVTVPVIVANKKSSCYLCSCSSTSLGLLPKPLQHLLQCCSIYRKHLELVHAQACCSACYRYQWMISAICASAYLIFYIHMSDLQYILSVIHNHVFSIYDACSTCFRFLLYYWLERCMLTLLCIPGLVDKLCALSISDVFSTCHRWDRSTMNAADQQMF